MFQTLTLIRGSLVTTKKGFCDAAYRKDTAGAWCVKDLDQTWWQPIHQLLVERLNGNASHCTDGTEKTGFESFLSQHIVYEDFFVIVSGRTNVVNYLSSQWIMFPCRYYDFSPPVFRPRLIGAERNVFNAEGSHVPNQLWINAMVSCSLWRLAIVIDSHIVLSFDDNNLVSKFQVKSSSDKGLNSSIKRMLGFYF